MGLSGMGPLQVQLTTQQGEMCDATVRSPPSNGGDRSIDRFHRGAVPSSPAEPPPCWCRPPVKWTLTPLMGLCASVLTTPSRAVLAALTKAASSSASPSPYACYCDVLLPRQGLTSSGI